MFRQNWLVNVQLNSSSSFQEAYHSSYVNGNHSSDQVYINPFDDWAFKRIFTVEAHKEVTIAFLNEVLVGKRQIASITFSKNEYPGEIKHERSSI